MPPDAAANPLAQLIPIFLIIFIFYFVLWKPQRNQEKQRKKMIADLKKNDQVVTTSGMHGTVVLVKDKSIVLRVDDNVKIEFDKEAVNTLVKSSE